MTNLSIFFFYFRTRKNVHLTKNEILRTPMFGNGFAAYFSFTCIQFITKFRMHMASEIPQGKDIHCQNILFEQWESNQIV